MACDQTETRNGGERADVVGSVLVIVTLYRRSRERAGGSRPGAAVSVEEKVGKRDVSKFASSSSRRGLGLVLRFGAAESRTRR